MFGATKEQWDHFVSLGLTADLLPVVSNPNAIISDNSSLSSLGKVPSKYYNGKVAGILDWTIKSATSKAIENWSSVPDYGVCIQTRNLRALDVDIDSDTAEDVKSLIRLFLGDTPFRTRANSKKFLFPFFLEGDHPKRVITLEDGIIEFLGNGQQFIASGTHPSGVRYELPLTTYPTLTVQEFEDLFDMITHTYKGVARKLNNNRQRGVDLNLQDEVINFIKANNLSLIEYRTKHHAVKCPWDADHTPGTGGKSSTIFLHAGTNGYEQGGFKCLHAHCADKTTHDYLCAIGFYEHQLDVEYIEPDAEVDEDFPVCPSKLIQDTANWITESGSWPQPELAILGTISFAAAVFGRRYRLDKLNTRTNVYIGAIAETGSGKDHARKQIIRLAQAANLSAFVPTQDVASGEGIPVMLQRSPSALMMLDEIGLLLRAIGDHKAPPHMKSAKKLLLQLYSSSGSVYQGGVYADKKREQIKVVDPNLCIYGTTTEYNYTMSVNPEAVASGELNRFVILKPKVMFPLPNPDADSTVIPEDIINRWASLADDLTFGEITSECEPETVYLQDPNQVRVLQEYQRDQRLNTTNDVGPLYMRYAENVLKIAMILAIADRQTQPLILNTHINFARWIVDKSILIMKLMVQAGVGQSRAEDPDIERVYNFIRTAPASKTVISRKFRAIHSTDIERILKTLINQRRIKPVTITTSGRPMTTYEVTE